MKRTDSLAGSVGIGEETVSNYKMEDLDWI